MHRTVLGSRSGPPAWWNQAAIGSPSSHGFRLGDRASAHLKLLDWRARNPDRRLTVYDDPYQPEGLHAACLTPEWLYGGVADEIVQAERHRELVDERPEGENLYCGSLWVSWRDLRVQRMAEPSVRPLSGPVESVRAFLARRGVPRRFLTLHPLWDAGYSIQRNRPPDWWLRLTARLSRTCPVVLLGSRANRQELGRFPAVAHYVEECPDAMHALAMISLSGLHVGGETGLTLWAPMMQVPTYALYHRPQRGPGADTMPIPFGASVSCGLLHFDPNKLVERISLAFAGR